MIRQQLSTSLNSASSAQGLEKARYSGSSQSKFRSQYMSSISSSLHCKTPNRCCTSVKRSGTCEIWETLQLKRDFSWSSAVLTKECISQLPEHRSHCFFWFSKWKMAIFVDLLDLSESLHSITGYTFSSSENRYNGFARKAVRFMLLLYTCMRSESAMNVAIETVVHALPITCIMTITVHFSGKLGTGCWDSRLCSFAGMARYWPISVARVGPTSICPEIHCNRSIYLLFTCRSKGANRNSNCFCRSQKPELWHFQGQLIWHRLWVIVTGDECVTVCRLSQLFNQRIAGTRQAQFRFFIHTCGGNTITPLWRRESASEVASYLSCPTGCYL